MAGLRPAVIHHGIDVEAFPFSSVAGDYLLFLGRLEQDKGPVTAVHAAREVGLPLVLAGPPSDYFTAEVAPLVDGVQVRYVGPVGRERRNQLLAGAATLVFPVTAPEPFGMVMIEAMACGTPVAAIPLGAVPEIVDPGVTGFLAADAASVPAAIESCLTLSREQVREVARRRFHYRRMVDDHERLYEQILARAQAAPGASEPAPGRLGVRP
jgi:glycosyltransferase involved in cell wall biosynthesis